MMATNPLLGLVAYGMIGASLSGVTFLSVPGLVGAKGFSYMQMVLGYQVGYLLIAYILIPRFYNQKVVSIYQYLEATLGMEARLVGALSFLASRVIGSAFRLFLVVLLLQHFVLDPLQIPIEVTVIITLLLIFAYTATGGVKTLVYTDTLQTSVMLLCAIVTLYLLAREMGDFSGLQASISQTTFDFEGFRNNGSHFVKQFLGGALLAFCMTGLDQDMMQKNLTCKNSKSGQKKYHHVKSSTHSDQSFVPWPRVLLVDFCPRSEPVGWPPRPSIPNSYHLFRHLFSSIRRIVCAWPHCCCPL